MEARFILLEELIRDERKEAKAEGVAEGMAKGMADSIIVLPEGLGRISDNLKNTIQEETDYGILKFCLKMAATVHSVEEFEESIRGMKTQ